MTKNVSPVAEVFNPFGELIGLKFSECENGRSTCFLEAIGDLHNPNGVLHGGVVYSLVDTGMGGALYTRLGEGESCATVEIKIVYFRPVITGTLTCVTKVIQRTKTLAFMESEVKAGDKAVARAMGTFSVFEAGRGGRNDS